MFSTQRFGLRVEYYLYSGPDFAVRFGLVAGYLLQNIDKQKLRRKQRLR